MAKVKQRSIVALDEYVATLDSDALKRLYSEVAEHRGELPCTRLREMHYVREGAPCGNPEPHESCSRCFTWRDCADSACDHPACGGGTAFRFREAFGAVHKPDVFIARTEAVPLLESGRLAEVFNSDNCEIDEPAGRRALEALQRQQGSWLNLYDVIDPMKHVAAKMWLAQERIAVEVSYARYQSPFWVAYAVAQSREINGGITYVEVRLAERVDLNDAPTLTQGALF